MTLEDIVLDFAAGFKSADALRPRAVSHRSGKEYQPGLGPHGENLTVALVLAEMRRIKPTVYAVAGPVPYPESRLKCDLGVGNPLEWVIEVKMARAYGDNAKLDDTYLKDLLSPYESDHSAFKDAAKLRKSAFPCNKAILVYGFDYPTRPLDLLLQTLEILLRSEARVSERIEVEFSDLVHPVHQKGRVIAWQI